MLDARGDLVRAAVDFALVPPSEPEAADTTLSGAEFKKRPGFVRLLNALSPRPPFQVLIMSEESRLGREAH